MARSSASDNARISAAALHLASGGWKTVTLEAVARKAKTPLSTLNKRFASVSGLVPVIAEEVDREAFTLAGKTKGAPQDALFDLLMARFDILQKNRKAILGMSEAARQDRELSCALARATLDGAYRLIDAANLSALPRPLAAAGLAAVYGWAFCAWRKDESRDMAKTMAALDRALRVAGKAATLFTRRS